MEEQEVDQGLLALERFSECKWAWVMRAEQNKKDDSNLCPLEEQVRILQKNPESRSEEDLKKLAPAIKESWFSKSDKMKDSDFNFLC